MTVARTAVAGLLIMLSAAPSNASEAEAVAEVHELIRGADSEAASRRLAALIPLHPSSAELRAYSVQLLVPRDADHAWTLAEQLRHARPDSPWSWYAVASAGLSSDSNDRVRSALDAIVKMEKLAPSPLPESMFRMKVRALMTAGGATAVLKYIGEREDAVALQMKAWAKESLPDPKADEEAAALYRRAMELAPHDVRIGVALVHNLSSAKSPDATPAARRLLAQAPLSLKLHEMYWFSILRTSEDPMERKAAVIEADMNELLAARDWPEVLQLMSDWTARLDRPERRAEIDRNLVSQFPESPEGQWAMHRLTFSERWAHTTDPAVLAERRNTIQKFLDYPHHTLMAALGDGYVRLLAVNRLDATISDAEYLRAIDGVLAYVRHPYLAKTEVAEALAERGLRLAAAEKLAREGLRDTPRIYELVRATIDDYDSLVTSYRGDARSVLGFVLMKRNRMAEAGRELQRAVKEVPLNPRANLHLATWQERKGDLTAAELTYARGMAYEPKEASRNLAALEALHRRRKGSSTQFDEYIANLRMAGSSDEQREVLATRLIPPKAVKEAFEAADLDSQHATPRKLDGRVTVVNFWGIWCGPCVSEMPYVQKLHEKYAGDQQVRILTVNTGDDPRKVGAWMAKNRYSFPVLLDKGFVDRSKKDIGGFPTTWFLDRNGRIAFVKGGATHNLVEEFSWRIDALKASSVQ